MLTGGRLEEERGICRGSGNARGGAWRHVCVSAAGFLSAEPVSGHLEARALRPGATQGQMDSFFSQLLYKCYLEEITSVGDWLKICPWVTSRVAGMERELSGGEIFFTLVTGPRRSLSLKLSDRRVYGPQIRARLGTTAHFCVSGGEMLTVYTVLLTPGR